MVPIPEEHPLHPQSPYAATKVGADQLALSYARSFDLPVVVARPFNTFGPRQSARAVIPTIVTQALTREHVELGSIEPTRDFLYVTDTVDGHRSLRRGRRSRRRGLQSGNRPRASRFARCVELRARGHRQGASGRVHAEERVRPAGSEVDRLCASVEKARERLGWEAKVSLRGGLADARSTGSPTSLDLYRPDDLRRLMEDVVVLAGGTGTRLRPYTTVLPKPLMPVGDMPVLEILLRRLAAAGLRPRQPRSRLPGRADRGVLRRRRAVSASSSSTGARRAARNGRPDRADGARRATACW